VSLLGGVSIGTPAAVESVEDNLDTAGNAELIKDSKQVILDGVLSELKALGDFAIGESLGDAANYIDFAGGKRGDAIAAEIGESRLCQRLEQIMQFGTAGPDLAHVYTLNALGKQAEGFGAAENPACAGAKRLNHSVTFRSVDHDHHARGWRLGTKTVNQIRCPPAVLTTQLGADDGDMRFLAFRQGQDSGIVGWRLDHLELRVSGERFHQ
jgi:hypothetical protein